MEPNRSLPGLHYRGQRRRPSPWAKLSRRAKAAVVGIVLALLGGGAALAAVETAEQSIACTPGTSIEVKPDGTWRCMDAVTPTAVPSSSTSTSTPAPTTTAPSSSTSTSTLTTTTTTAAPSTSTSTSTTPALRVIRAYITGYSYFDNTPPGSADISHPVLHSKAGGAGTYADPITVAVGHSITGGRDVLDWPAGTRFYVPNLRRYFIVEDSCGDGSRPQNGPCHVGYPSGATTWLDVWVGGQGGTSGGSDRCMGAITKVSTVVVDPPAGYPVTTGNIYTAAGCTAQHGDSIPAVS